MNQYIVHLFREMRLSYTGIEADTPQAAAISPTTSRPAMPTTSRTATARTCPPWSMWPGTRITASP